MGKLKSALKNIGNGLGDLGKGIAKIAVAPVNSLTGHEFDPKMKTKVGQALEWVGDVVEDTQTQALKTASGGLLNKNRETETQFGTILGKAAGVAGLAAVGTATVGLVAGKGFSVKEGAKVIGGGAGKIFKKSNNEVTKTNNGVVPTKSNLTSDDTIDDALGIASVSSGSDQLPDVLQAGVAVGNATGNKGKLDSALSGLGNLLSPDNKRKVGGVLDGLGASLGIKKNPTTGQTKMDFGNPIVIIIAIVLVIVVIKMFK
jgi:hypothetical protein